MFCKRCGTMLKAEAEFCRKCGIAVSARQSSPSVQSATPVWQDKLADAQIMPPTSPEADHGKSKDASTHGTTPASQASRRPSGNHAKILAAACLAALAMIAIGTLVWWHDAPSSASSDNTATWRSSSGDSIDTEDAYRYSDELYFSEPDEAHIIEEAEGIGYIDNEIILCCEAGYAADEVLAAAGESGFAVVGRSEPANSFQVRLSESRALEDIEALCEGILAQEGVAECLPHYAFALETSATTEDAAWTEPAQKGMPSKTWGLEHIQAPQAWDLVQATSDVRIGIMDDQFFTHHEDLEGAFAQTMPSSDTQFDVKIERELFDMSTWKGGVDDHGTHVAGIIGAHSNKSGSVGVAHGASLYGYSCLGGKDNRGRDKLTAGYSIDVALTYLIVMCDCDIINMSVHMPTPQIAASKGKQNEAQKLEQIGEYLAILLGGLIRGGYDDFLICKIAGNQGTEGLADWDFLGLIDDEEVSSHIVIVGSLAQEKDASVRVASDSSCGERVDVYAPGQDVYSTVYGVTDKRGVSIPYSDYAYMSGTSMAAPMVTGAAALVKAANPQLSGPEIKEIICSTLKGSYTDATGVTRGGLDAEAAVAKALGLKQPAETPAAPDSSAEPSDSDGSKAPTHTVTPETPRTQTDSFDEAAARAATASQTGQEILYLYCADFDSNGSDEAFVLTGEWDESLGPSCYGDATLWFADATGARKVEGGLYGFSNGIQDLGTYKFLSLERSAGGSGSSSSVFGVKNGAARKMTFQGSSSKYHDVTWGTYGDVQKNGSSDQLKGYISVWDNGFHEYAWCYFELRSIDFAFELVEVGNTDDFF